MKRDAPMRADASETRGRARDGVTLAGSMGRAAFAALGVVALGAGCGASQSERSHVYTPPPKSVVVEDPGPVAIRREAFVIDGAVPPPNPRSGENTPPEQNA